MALHQRLATACLAGAAFLLGFQQAAIAQDKGKSLVESVYSEYKSGKIKIEGDHAAVTELVIKRDIPITYEYIAQLMRTPNAFGAGPACIVCHGSSDPSKSYRGLNLSTCEGILAGATESPARRVVIVGSPDKGIIGRMVRNNRMPLGISFAHPTDTAEINAVKDWINAGAKDDEQGKNVLALFKKSGAFGTDQACVDCHMSNQEPPSFRELDLSSYKGVMKGAYSTSNGKDGKTAASVVVPGSAAESPLYRRLTENRMPPGIDPGESVDHPNIQLLLHWIKQGAKCN
jgi:mono/diheme cytochrome c family protein